MRIPLTGGSYKARSLIANAQRCVNLYGEKNPKGSPVPMTYYQRPGLTLLGTAPVKLPYRGLYFATTGTLYGVIGTNVYSIGPTWIYTLLGKMTSTTSQVSMMDNGLVLIIVDGTKKGYCINLQSNVFSTINDLNFLGANRVDYIDTFFIFNQPNTQNWYSSLSNITYNMLANPSGGVLTGAVTDGAGYTNGTFTNVNLNGGSGTGAIGTIVVAGGIVTTVTPTTAGINYVSGDVLTATLTGSGVQTGTIAGGTAYTNGTYTGVSLTGGTGTGATANITVAGNVVTAVVPVNPGTGYAIGNVLTATIPAGSGFTYTLTGMGATGFSYTVLTINQAFNPLYIAAKTGYPDNLIGLMVVHHEIWLFGSLTTEIWYNAGNNLFPFQIIPGVFVNHGCLAPYSLATQDIFGYWLGSDKQGQRIIFKGGVYQAKRISTHALENEMMGYSTVSDAIGFTYQQNGHAFYILIFPSANKSWCWDESTEEWHELAATDPQGDLMRHWANTMTPAYDIIVVGDYTNGNLYKLDLNNYTDNGNPIHCIRGFPHLEGEDGERYYHHQFIADMEVGTDDGFIDSTSQALPPKISLRWSDDRGKTFGNYVTQSLGALGQYLTSIQWRRLGFSRDRVYELEWSIPTKTALNGAFVDVKRGET